MSEQDSRCGVCQALLDEEDLFCSNCGAEAPARAGQKPPDQSRIATYNFQCAGCGASMSYDASAGNLRCPFCASEELVKQVDAKVLSPQRVVPLELTKDAAVARMRDWLAKGFWRPGDLRTQALVVAMTPVYVPYWVFQAKTHTYWAADTSRTPAGARASWYPVSGEHRGRYEGLLVGASSTLTPQETAQIAPFDLGRGVAPEEIDLVNVTVEQFSVGRKYARPLARQGLEELERVACQQHVPDRCRNLKVNLRIEGLTSEPVLLPVWVMAYRYRDQVYRFLVNGQTGRAAGQAPVSYRKIAAAIALGVAAVVAIGALIAVLARS